MWSVVESVLKWTNGRNKYLIKLMFVHIEFDVNIMKIYSVYSRIDYYNFVNQLLQILQLVSYRNDSK